MNMNTINRHNRFPGSQTGVALVVSLLFLLVVTIISIAATSNSTLGLKMSSNLQEGYRSFQAAEAGVYAVLGLVGTGNDPFAAQADDLTPFAGVTPDPLRDVTDPNAPQVDVDVLFVAANLQCKRPTTETGGNSINIDKCDFYQVVSEHDDPGISRSRVEIGVVRPIAGDNG